MTLLRAHQAVVAVAVLAVAALGAAFFALTRPANHQSATPPSDLPYTAVSYSTSDALHAFAQVGVRLSPRSKTPTVVTTVGNRGNSLEVDVFGDPQKVRASGFHDYLPSHGHYVHFPSTCGTGLPDAEIWKGNVRVVVHCGAAAPSAAWLQRAHHALDGLS